MATYRASCPLPPCSVAARKPIASSERASTSQPDKQTQRQHTSFTLLCSWHTFLLVDKDDCWRLQVLEKPEQLVALLLLCQHQHLTRPHHESYTIIHKRTCHTFCSIRSVGFPAEPMLTTAGRRRYVFARRSTCGGMVAVNNTVCLYLDLFFMLDSRRARSSATSAQKDEHIHVSWETKSLGSSEKQRIEEGRERKRKRKEERKCERETKRQREI